MRTYLILFLSSFILLSCDSSFPEELTTKQVFHFTVKQADWIPNTDANGLNLYYKSKQSIDGISNYYINNGATMGFIEFDGFEQALPYTRHFENANGTKWTRTIDFDFSKTDVQFYVTNNDFKADPPETMNFKVVFIW